MRTIVDLYRCMQVDPRLQKDWETNQSRVDRCLEAPLIVNTFREVATAALLWLKLRFETDSRDVPVSGFSPELLTWARDHRRDSCKGGPRLANVVQNPESTDDERHSAIASLHFYHDRAGPNSLVRLRWSDAGIRALAQAPPLETVTPRLRVTNWRKASEGVVAVAALLLDPPSPVTRPLPKMPGIGDERSDAIGVFALRQGWPIIDKALWELCSNHGVLSPEEAPVASYPARRKVFAKYWDELKRALPSDEPGNLAATLYLWSNEASRFGFRYWQLDA